MYYALDVLWRHPAANLTFRIGDDTGVEIVRSPVLGHLLFGLLQIAFVVESA
jgi:hypothetical protein